MQRIFPAARAGDRFGMADMIRPAGEEKAADGVQNTGIAVIGHGTTRRQFDSIDPAGSYIERRSQIEL
jgi:hypothetical protein